MKLNNTEWWFERFTRIISDDLY